MKTNTLADNRALMQVLTHSENLNRPPTEIVKSALAGGVVSVFVDEEKRFAESALLPSSRDLNTLSELITEGFFAPFIYRALGDQLPRYTIVAESGCFEILSLPVILFPDCFLASLSLDISLSNSRSVSTQSVNPNVNVLNTSHDSSSSQPGFTISAVVADVEKLHQLRLHVGFLFLKNVNEILRDAELWKIKVSRQQTSSSSLDAANISSVMALFYEVKMILLCCILSSNRAYNIKNNFSEIRKSAKNYFDDLLNSNELYRIFEERSRPCEEDVGKWYDNMLNILNSKVSIVDNNLQDLIVELQSEVMKEGKRVSVIPLQLLHRPHDASSTTFLKLPFVHVQNPLLDIQPGELNYLFGDSLQHLLLFDSEPSKLCLLLRRSCTTKFSITQIREYELLLAKYPWRKLSDVVIESLQQYFSDDQFLFSMIEKNSSFVAKLVQWLQETSLPILKENSITHDINNNNHNEEQQQDEENKRMRIGTILANDIIERVIHNTPFGAAVAQFIREVVSCGALTEPQLQSWVEHSLEDLENKSSTTIGLFALVVAFALAQCGWQLQEGAREATVKLCTQHRQQPNCLTLLQLLRRHSA